MEEKDFDTTIRVKSSTRKTLELFGKFGESYDDVIKKLIGIYKENDKFIKEKQDLEEKE